MSRAMLSDVESSVHVPPGLRRLHLWIKRTKARDPIILSLEAGADSPHFVLNNAVGAIVCTNGEFVTIVNAPVDALIVNPAMLFVPLFAT